MDPLASEFPGYSPYNYVLGNPLKFIDPDGCAPEGEGDDPFLMARLVKTMFYDAKHSIENIVMNAFVPHDDGMKWQADYAKDVNVNQKFETIIQQVPSQGAFQDGASLALDGVNNRGASKLNTNDFPSSKTGTNQIVKEAKAVVHGNSKLSPRKHFYTKNMIKMVILKSMV